MNYLKKNKSKYFYLYACCLLTKGKKRALLCDTQRNQVYFIPNDLFNILNNKSIRVKSLYEKFGESNFEALNDYFGFLIENDLGTFVDENDIFCFDKIKLTWDMPNFITNAILEIKEFDLNLFSFIINQLDRLGCISIQVNILYCIKYEDFFSLLSCFNSLRISSLNIYTYYSDTLFESIESLINRFLRINQVLLCNAPLDTKKQYINKNSSVILIQADVLNFKNCGNITTHYFSNNITIFTEAQKHNTCLNRKISIDTEGYIRNCPSMKEHYGNIKDTTLQQALEHPDFKKYWFINKDQIAVCKDCEFRYICTDCRAYLENPEDMHSKPLKCGYNPYTNEWEEWSTNPLKQKAIDHYGMRELVNNG